MRVCLFAPKVGKQKEYGKKIRRLCLGLVLLTHISPYNSNTIGRLTKPLEMQNGIRVNVVSSGLVEDSLEKYRNYFPGHNAIPMNKVVNGYVRSVKGKDNGRIIRIYD